MNVKIVIATIMREHGETGVQTHFRRFMEYLEGEGKPGRIATPFHAPKSLVYPVFGLRKAIDRLSGRYGVWWYRYWHSVFLETVLKGILRDDERAIVYAQCPVSAKAALRARRNTSQKVFMVVHFNHSQAEEWAEKGKIRKGDWVYENILRLEKEVMPQLDGIVFVSRYMADHIERRIPEIRNVRKFISPNFMRKEVGEPTNVKGDLINIGTLESRKNQEYLLRVLFECARVGKSYTLTLVGEGPDRNRLESLSEALGIRSQVNFLGYRKSAARLLDGHKVYVHASRMENLPYTIIEAFAFGIPVIAGAVGGIPEILAEDGEGYFWPLDDPAEGARRVITVLENEALRRRLSEGAGERFLRDFESTVVAGRLHEFLTGHFSGCRSGQVPGGWKCI